MTSRGRTELEGKEEGKSNREEYFCRGEKGARESERKMSLSLVQGYESEEEARFQPPLYVDSDDEDEDRNIGGREELQIRDEGPVYGEVVDLALKITPPGEKRVVSSLPSALDVFSEVTGPPEFLRPAALAPVPSQKLLRSTVSDSRKINLQDSGAVIEAKAQRTAPNVSDPKVGGSGLPPIRQVKGAQMPPVEDAVHLLSACDKCHVPKTFSSARGGMVCPLCSDRGIQTDNKVGEGAKKRDGSVKDKEKTKRMKGQSTHATWKSETEMQLRQTYD